MTGVFRDDIHKCQHRASVIQFQVGRWELLMDRAGAGMPESSHAKHWEAEGTEATALTQHPQLRWTPGREQTCWPQSRVVEANYSPTPPRLSEALNQGSRG